MLAREGGRHYQQSKCNGCDEPSHNRLRSLSACRKSKTGASLDRADLAKTADSGLTDRRSEIPWNINTFHFPNESFVQNPAGRREGAGLETPYELDVESLSPASIESKALAKG